MARSMRAREGWVMKTAILVALSVVFLGSLVEQAVADESPPMPEPGPAARPSATAEELYNQGLRWQRQGQYGKAIEAYQQAVRLKPDFAEAYNHLGYTYRMSGDFDRAIAAYREALRLKPDFAEAHEYLGKAYLAKGMRAEAEAQYRILQRLNPAMAAELGRLLRR
jgi:tetratricopeptide (TPR) repeat protein